MGRNKDNILLAKKQGYKFTFNQLKKLNLDINNRIGNLDCSNNFLSLLDLSKLTYLHTLDISNNQIEDIDLKSKQPGQEPRG